MNKRTATVARVRIVATRMGHAADLYDLTAMEVPADQPLVADLLTNAAQRLRAFQRELMGDIGEPRREYEAEPIETPAEVPTTEPAPREPVPA